MDHLDRSAQLLRETRLVYEAICNSNPTRTLALAIDRARSFDSLDQESILILAALTATLRKTLGSQLSLHSFPGDIEAGQASA